MAVANGSAEVGSNSSESRMRAFEDEGALTACLTDAVQDERPAQESEAAVRCAGDRWRRDSSSIGLTQRYRYRERVIGGVRFEH